MKTTIVILIALLGLAATAEAQPQNFAQRGRVGYLAQELAETAHDASQTAEDRARHFGRRAWRSLDALHRLDRKARRFNRTVRQHNRQSRRAENAYWRLVKEYHQTQRVLRRSHTVRPVARDMRRIGLLLDRIAYTYQGSGHYGYRGPYRDNDHDRGNDYDDGYYGKKKRNDEPRRAPRGSTLQN